MKNVVFPGKKCVCGKWFPATRSDREHCNQACANLFRMREKRKKIKKTNEKAQK